MRRGYFARDHLGHGTLRMRHKTAVRPEHLERAAKPLVGISQRWLTAPQFSGAPVEFLNNTRSIDGVDGHRTQVEQCSIPLFRAPQCFVRALALGKIDSRRSIKLRAVAVDVICSVAAAASIRFSRPDRSDFCFVHNRGTNSRARIQILLVKASPRKAKKQAHSDEDCG